MARTPLFPHGGAHGIQRILYVFRPPDIIGSRLLSDERPETPYPVVAMTPLRAVAIGKTSAMDSLLLATSSEIPVRLCKLLLEFAERVELRAVHTLRRCFAVQRGWGQFGAGAIKGCSSVPGG